MEPLWVPKGEAVTFLTPGQASSCKELIRMQPMVLGSRGRHTRKLLKVLDLEKQKKEVSPSASYYLVPFCMFCEF